MIQTFLKELEGEAETTRKILSIVPDDKYQWKPHEKSMTIQQLATHIAELPTWVPMTLNTSELDFATSPYTQKRSTTQRISSNYLKIASQNVGPALQNAREEQLLEPWTLRNGDQIYSTDPKQDVIRMAFSQIIHHRAQLGVFLRLLNIPIPGSYGPSADENILILNKVALLNGCKNNNLNLPKSQHDKAFC
jgi:uncharacterized damage-inducible protein DinB